MSQKIKTERTADDKGMSAEEAGPADRGIFGSSEKYVCLLFA